MVSVQAVYKAYTISMLPQQTSDIQQSQRLSPHIISSEVVYPGVYKKDVGIVHFSFELMTNHLLETDNSSALDSILFRNSTPDWVISSSLFISLLMATIF